MPPATIDAFRDHGDVARTVDKRLGAAEGLLRSSQAVGLSMKDVTDKLLVEGLASFQKSFDSLLGGIEKKMSAASRSEVTATVQPRTKIVCTLGPATAHEEAIRSLMEAGMNVARLNFSHGTHEQHAGRSRSFAPRAASSAARSRSSATCRVRASASAIFPERSPSRPARTSCSCTKGCERRRRDSNHVRQLSHDVHVGDRILVDDGLIELVALEVNAPRVQGARAARRNDQDTRA